MIEVTLYENIQHNFRGYNKLKASCEFNISYYATLLSMIEQQNLSIIENNVMSTVVYFFIKEKSLLAVMRNLVGVYELSLMFPTAEVLDVAMGKSSQLISINSDVDKMALLIGLYSQLSSKTKNQILEETLLFSKSMI